MDFSSCIRVQNTFPKTPASLAVAKEGQLTEVMKGTIQALISMDAISVVDPRPQLFQHSFKSRRVKGWGGGGVTPCDQT